jgi:hypothetical protein
MVAQKGFHMQIMNPWPRAWSNRFPLSSGRPRFASPPNRCRATRFCWCLGFLFALAWLLPLQARAKSPIDGVTVKGGKPYSLQAGKLELVTNNFTLPFDVEINTNGTFKVGEKGQERTLREGQVIRSDGWLTSPDGAVEPVFDHLAVQGGKVLVVTDGESAPLAQPMTCTNGLQLSPGGGCTYPGGRQAHLLDGQLFRLDGTPVLAEDAATLVNGQVVVQRDGALIRLAPVQMMGMSDGTKVYGSGTIQKHDGTILKLEPGQTVLMEGIRVGQ